MSDALLDRLGGWRRTDGSVVVPKNGWDTLCAEHEGNGMNAFDRTMDFTLYCHNPEQVAAMADWLVRHDVSGLTINDDRGASGAWTVVFEHNAKMIIQPLSEACRLHKVDVMLSLEAS